LIRNILSRVEITAELGEFGTGEVYRAEHANLGLE